MTFFGNSSQCHRIRVALVWKVLKVEGTPTTKKITGAHSGGEQIEGNENYNLQRIYGLFWPSTPNPEFSHT